ncbi:hypothetical protein SH501x_001644 [Pirellulaceae bacterium SH501]
MATRWIVLLPFVASLLGCTTTGIRSGRQISEAFDSIDSIEIGEVILSDPQLIAELKAVHSRSKWATPITMPSDLVVIYGVDEGVRRFKLVYGAGWLWETDEDGQISRRKTLNENDRLWMEENIRLKLPPKPKSF